MAKFIPKIGKKLFGSQLDFRVRLFNIMGSAGILSSLVMCVVNIFSNSELNAVRNLLVAILVSIALMWYATATGKYQRCYVVTIICIFLIFFSLMFFDSGGYYSGNPSFFIFAILFTVFMLEGKKVFVITGLELAVYTAICIYAYHNPEKIKPFQDEMHALAHILTGFLVVSVILSVVLFMHFRLYDRRQKELEEAHRQLEEYAKMKSKLFAGMSHEMRTPLTVMSAYAQYAVEQIKKSGANEQTLADLDTISREARRLAEMADGTLKVLMASTALGDAETKDSGRKALPVDVGNISLSIVKLLESVALRKGIKISAAIDCALPTMHGDADAITQLVWNILQNAITHSECKSVVLQASALAETAPGVIVTVKDDGVGIDPEILPRIFERGVSGKKDGSGIGLAICRDIAERHGGDISVQSESGAGTVVTVTLRGSNGGVNA